MFGIVTVLQIRVGGLKNGVSYFWRALQEATL